MWIRSGGRAFVLGALSPDDGAITTYGAPVLADALGTPTEFDAVIGGEQYRIDILHTLPVLASNANGNLIGFDHTREDLMAFAECPFRATDSDGSVGYDHLERGARRETLRPQPTVRVARRHRTTFSSQERQRCPFRPLADALAAN